ncbi:MAG: hypothetical protein LBQ87_04760 [Candidatus Fibromonas sp.]|jgi:hypothetical protein|nr:hypothetical protein [Candidatus Fibromonas sp.]
MRYIGYMNKVLGVVLLWVFVAFGQTERIAIMHTVDDGDSVNVMDLGYLTDKLRDIGGQVLPKNRYGIMTQQSIVDRLGSQEKAEKECRAATCIADLGRKINADYIAQGRIGRFSGKLTMKVELYKVSNSNLIGSFTGDSRDMDGLLALLEAKAPKLFDAMPGVSSPEPLPPPPPPVAVSVPALPEKFVVPAPPAVPEPAPPAVNDLKDAVDVDLGYKAPKSIDPQVEMEEFQSSSTSFWVALALDIAGAALIINGVLKNSEMLDRHDEYRSLSRRNVSQSDFNNAWGKVEDAESSRNFSIGLGSVLLAAGIGVHIWF